MSVSHSPGLRSVSMWRCKSAEATVMRDLHFAPSSASLAGIEPGKFKLTYYPEATVQPNSR